MFPAEYVVTKFTEHPGFLHARHLEHGLIDIGDPPVPIHGDDAVGHGAQYDVHFVLFRDDLFARLFDGLEELGVQQHFRGVARKEVKQVQITLIEGLSFGLVKDRQSSHILPLVDQRNIGETLDAQGIEGQGIDPGIHDRIVREKSLFSGLRGNEPVLRTALYLLMKAEVLVKYEVLDGARFQGRLEQRTGGARDVDGALADRLDRVGDLERLVQPEGQVIQKAYLLAAFLHLQITERLGQRQGRLVHNGPGQLNIDLGERFVTLQ